MIANETRVVFDCNVFLQALLNPAGIAAKCKKLVDHQTIILFVSVDILREVSEVLQRPRFQILSSHLTSERITAFLEDIADKAIPLMNVPDEYHFERDPKDEPYVNLAIVARAKYLVSYDKDLLDLMKGETESGRDFQRRYPMLKIVEPLAFLREIEALS
jgi:putative PIN family toxin of toxin-antitoxin system